MKGNRKEYVLGIDLGTSGVKAGLLDLASLKLGFVRAQPYEDAPGQDPDVLWAQAAKVVGDSAAAVGTEARVAAIGLTGQMHGAVLYDAQGQLLGPIINWKDRKWSGGPVVEKIRALLAGRDYDDLGTEIASGYTAAILFGVKASDPDLYHRIAHVVLPVDFLRGRLLEAESYATDPTNACGTGLYNTRAGRWHTELLERLGLSETILPELHATDEVAGTTRGGLARDLGLAGGTPVVFGGGDNQVGMLGSGLAGPGSPMLVNIGTAAQVSKVIADFRRYPGLDTRSYLDGQFAAVYASLGGGGSYAWLKTEIERGERLQVDFPQMDRAAADVPPGADRLMFCPGPTRQQPDRARRFLGNMARAGDLAHRARAVLEGVVMDLYDGYEILEKHHSGDRLLGAGKGLQRSRVWAQIAADLFRKPIRVAAGEAGVLGAALLAARGVGATSGLGQAARAAELGAEVAPDRSRAAFYRDEFVGAWREAVGRA